MRASAGREATARRVGRPRLLVVMDAAPRGCRSPVTPCLTRATASVVPVPRTYPCLLQELTGGPSLWPGWVRRSLRAFGTSNRVRVDRGLPQSGELFFDRSAPCLQWCFVGECTVERRHGQSLYQLQRTRRDAMYGVCWVGVATLHPSCGTDQCYLIV